MVSSFSIWIGILYCMSKYCHRFAKKAKKIYSFYMLTITLIVIISILSMFLLRNQDKMNIFMLHTYHFWKQKKYYQIITSWLIHADEWHLLLNMYALWLFGHILEIWFSEIYSNGALYFLALFFWAIITTSLFDIFMNNDEPNYATLGSSGAVSAIIFAYIVVFPTDKIGLIFFPVMIPGWVFWLLYLAYCVFKDYKSNDNINHMAHFIWGIFWILFMLLTWADTLSNFAYQLYAN